MGAVGAGKCSSGEVEMDQCAPRVPSASPATQPPQADVGSRAIGAESVLRMQRSVGNRAVTAMLLRSGAIAPPSRILQRCGPGGCTCGGRCEEIIDDEQLRRPTAALRRSVGNRAALQALQRVAFTPGIKHDHTPSGRWADVQAAPNSGFFENRVCANSAPRTVVDLAIWAKFDDKPIAKRHLEWYLSTGKGADFVEDTYLDRMLRTDTGVQAAVLALLPSPWPTAGTFTDHVKIEQSDYVNQDFRFAFGAIDRLDFEVDWAARTLHAWFQDRYEWHPVYSGLYTKYPDDAARETNCVHAALVELQSSGAADFWMKGEATVPLPTPPSSTSARPWWQL